MQAQTARRNIRLLYGFWFLRDFHLWIPVWIVFLTEQRGFSLTEVTGAEGLYLVGIVFLEVPTGAVADRWGRSKSLALGALCLAGATFIFAFTESFAVLLASFLLWSVAHTLMSGADSALLYDNLKDLGEEHRFERASGRGAACSWAGAGIGTLLGGPVAALTSIRFTILLGSATCVVAALAALLIAEGMHEEHAARPGYFRSIRLAFGEAWHNPTVRAVILLTGVITASLEAVHYLVQPYLVDRGVDVGIWFSMLQVPTILFGVGGALLASSALGQKRPFAAMLAIPAAGVAGYLLLAAGPGLSAYAVLPVMFALDSWLRPLAAGYINRQIGSERRATVLSMQGMVGSLTLAALAPGAGYLTDERGLTWAFAAGAVVTLAGLAAFGLPLLARLGRGEPPLLDSVLPAEP